MNKQFQEDIKLAHAITKNINRKLSLAEISIVWIDLKDILDKTIWDKRRNLLEQLKQCSFNVPNKKEMVAK
jgi:hypothetical protein